MTDTQATTAKALYATLTSPNVSDSNMDPANLVDVIDDLATSTRKIANAITAPAAAGQDAPGGMVMSLTEAVRGNTKALFAIADAIESLARAVYERP